DPGVFNKYPLSINGRYDQITSGDFDGDGIDDIALYAAGPAMDKVMYGTRTGGEFGYANMNVQLDSNYQITSGRYNDDNRSDLFLYNPNGPDFVLVGRTRHGDFGKYSTNPQI